MIFGDLNMYLWPEYNGWRRIAEEAAAAEWVPGAGDALGSMMSNKFNKGKGKRRKEEETREYKNNGEGNKTEEKKRRREIAREMRRTIELDLFLNTRLRMKNKQINR